jgi:serine phosphatase RsbU (regulator of sigma subunit)
MSSIGFSQTKYDTTEFKKNYKIIDKTLERNVDSALILIKNELQKTFKFKYSYGYAKTNLQLARYYTLKAKVDSSLIFLPTAIKYARISKDTALIVSSYLFYARSLSTSSQFDKAIEQALIAQRFAENYKDYKIKTKLFHDLGFIHSGIGLHSKAIDYYKKGLAISVQNKDTFNFANISARLGGEFQYINNNDSALKYNLQGLNYFTLIHHKRGIGVSMVNLATTYAAMNQIDKAIKITEDAIVIRKELGDDYAVTMLKVNLTDCYLDKKLYEKALSLAKECEVLAKNQNENELILQNYSSLRRVYHALNNNNLAYFYANKLIALKDSLFEKKDIKAITELQTKYETEKKEQEIVLLQVESKSNLEKSSAERNSRNLIIGSISLISLLIALFAALLFKRFKIINRQKHIIEKQKELVDEKNKEVTDSINYALTIQQAVIPSESDLKDCFTDVVVLFKPKDIVSGDFYWNTKINDYIFYVVADCTGHGVPGAFMSLMGINYLNEIINEKKIIDTAEILNALREKVITNLNKSNSTIQKRDGMDLVLFRLHVKTFEIQFSGANNSIYFLNHDSLEELKGNKMPIGLHTGDMNKFTSTTRQLTKSCKIFAFTDGFPDQFGGGKGKKFMYKKLENLILDNSNTKLPEFKEKLINEFESWKGVNEQVDDVTFLGIEI